MKIAGIDYGSKLAGTTVIASTTGTKIELLSSEKKKDADQFILNWAKAFQPETVFLDAPLSLPGKLRELEGYTDYFYRVADREVSGMSPMFLGGLTARAMRLKGLLLGLNIEVVEIYPSKLAEELGLKEINYKKQKEHLQANLTKISPFLSDYQLEINAVKTWHHFDALLALISGFRYLNKECLFFGEEKEGIIVV